MNTGEFGIQVATLANAFTDVGHKLSKTSVNFLLSCMENKRSPGPLSVDGEGNVLDGGLGAA